MTALPPLPPLPNIDGALIVDNSALEDLQNCPWLYYVKHVLRRVPVDGKAPLIFGGGIHSALRHRYTKLLHLFCDDVTESEQITALREHFHLHPVPAQDHRQCELAEVFIHEYNKAYKREPFTIVKHNSKPVVELPFVFKLGVLSNGQTLLYSGRMDLVINDNEGVWVFDHKTTFEFGLGFENIMRITPQMRGYAYACKEVLKQTPVGYIVNAIRVRKPKVQDLFDPQTGVRPDDFKRIREHLSYHELDEWKQNTLEIAEELIFYHSRGVFPLHRKHCVAIYGKCSLYDVCTIHKDQRLGWLQGHVFEDNDWSPLNLPPSISKVE